MVQRSAQRDGSAFTEISNGNNNPHETTQTRIPYIFRTDKKISIGIGTTSRDQGSMAHAFLQGQEFQHFQRSPVRWLAVSV